MWESRFTCSLFVLFLILYPNYLVKMTKNAVISVVCQTFSEVLREYFLRVNLRSLCLATIVRLNEPTLIGVPSQLCKPSRPNR